MQVAPEIGGNRLILQAESKRVLAYPTLAVGVQYCTTSVEYTTTAKHSNKSALPSTLSIKNHVFLCKPLFIY